MTENQLTNSLPQRAENLNGRRFGRLVAVAYAGHGGGGLLWRCRCDCGGERTSLAVNLKAGRTLSCGCLHHELLVARNHAATSTVHGSCRRGGRTPEHSAWQSMLQRCLNPKNPSYADYGGRGIVVCERWADSFEDFLSDVGPRPSESHSIDRIDNGGNYEPGNVRWATAKQQQRNTRRNRLITHAGETMTPAGWAERAGMSYACLLCRLKRGWSVADALTRPSERQVKT